MRSKTHLATLVICCLMSTGSINGQVAPRPSTQQEEREAWVFAALEHMQAVKPGMTRADLIKAFRAQGGTATRQERTYASRDCKYFHVDVEFRVVHEPGEATRPRTLNMDQWGADVIVKISTPYVAPFEIG